MKHTRFTVPALLASLLLTGVLLACSDAQDTSDTADGGVTPTTTANVTEADEIAHLYINDLTPTDFGGREIRIASSNDLVGYQIPTTIQFATEETGEIVNDTLFARDLWIEETYHVDVVFSEKGDWDSENYLKAIQAGDLPFECIIHDTAEVCNLLSVNGAIYPLNMVDSINLNADYWFPALNKELYVGEDLYFAACPISPRYYGSVYVMMFNRDLATDLDLPDLYDSVKAGTWTVDQMAECAKAALRDVNGDSVMDENDTWGLWYEVLTPEAMILGAGHHLVENNNGEMKIMLEDERLLDFMNRIAEIYQQDYTVYDGGGLDTGIILDNGNYLFWNPCTFNLAGFREYTYDFGILPMPKADEEQEQYYAYSQPWATATAMIPVTVQPEDLNFVGTVIDAMTAYGYDYVRPAVFDNVIQLKSTRDEQSAGIIDLIFENVTFEVSTIFGSDFYITMRKAFTSELGKAGITSTYASIKDKSVKELEERIGVYRDFHDEFESALGR